MSKAFKKNRKLATSVVAVGLAAVIVFGGTFAWTSISQQALNEVAATRNPGGRLHDDFNDITEADGTMTFDKNVYVENFTTLATNGVQVFARIRLDEYMELGDGAGLLNEDGTKPDTNKADSLVYGAELGDKSTWRTHIPGDDTENPFNKYWIWDADGGQVTYMPTFNKNKDSLEADINGTFDADFTDYVDYTEETTKEGAAVYDDDDNDVDEIVMNNWNAETAANHGYVTIENETHESKLTLDSTVMTMDEWLLLPADQQIGNFWVWDADGWAYWASPINPDEATGVLLDGISRTEIAINDDWYYGINVVAQFITKEDIRGKDGNGGFYDTQDGSLPPSSKALVLLNAIGVEINTTVDTPEGLQAAMELGGNITLSGEVNAENVQYPFGDDQEAVEYAWNTGGTLTGGTIIADNSAYAGLFINNENNYPTSGKGSAEAAVNGVTITGNSVGYSIYAQAIDQNITLTEVDVTNSWGGGILAEFGSKKVILNGCTVTVPVDDTTADDYQQSAVAASGGANIVINEGTYTGKYAAYVYSTGGTITINGGTFYGELQAADAGTIEIKGGSFSADPTAFLKEGYTATLNTDTGLYEVK